LIQIADPVLRAEFEARLDWWGIQVFACRDIEEAWQISDGRKPTLHIVQWNANDAAALDFCRRIRTGSGGHLNMIWLVTDRSGPVALHAALDSGVDDCLSLPVDWQWVDVRLAAAK